MGRIKFSKLIQDDYKEFGREGSKAITAAGKAGWKAAVQINNYYVHTGSLRANWKLSTRMDYYEPVRYGSKDNPRPAPNVPDFKYRITKDKGVYIFNNMKYADKVEYGMGPGARSPALMIPAAKVAFTREAMDRFDRIIIG